MRLPSLIFILSEIRQALLRFPLALLSIIIAGICAVLLIENEDPGRLLPLLMSSQLGLPLLLAFTLLGERLGASLMEPAGEAVSRFRSGAGTWLILQLGGVVLLVLYYVSLPDIVEGAPLVRFFQLNVGLHLLVSFIPFIRHGGNNSVWQFNRLLLQRLLAGAVFSFTLFAGLSLALFALDKLFGLAIDDEIYPRLFMLVAFIFNSWYFLGGVPRDIPALEKPIEYPKILKIFSQYILATLVAIYLSILLAYLIKVVITAVWPSGWIGNLVSSVAAAGLFSLVALYPLADRKENRWVATYARLFYILLLPAVGMLLLAIYKRVDQYGITENRYYLIVLALWLSFTSIKGLIEKRPNLKTLPLSLCLLAFLTSCGPWGVFSIARESQTRRVSGLLVANGMFEGDKLVRPTGAVSEEDSEQIGDVFNYLIKQHGQESVSPWFDGELSALMSTHRDSLTCNLIRPASSGEVILDYLGLDYSVAGDRTGSRKFRFTRDTGDDLLEIDGYSYAQPISISSDSDVSFELAGEQYQVTVSAPEPELVFVAAGEERLRLPLASLLSSLVDRPGPRSPGDRAPGALLTAEISSGGLRVMLVILEIEWTGAEDGSREIGALEGVLLIEVIE